MESKELVDEDVTNVTKRESYLSDPSQAGGRRSDAINDDDDDDDNVGEVGDARATATTANDDDVVPEEFLAYRNEK